MKKSDFSSISVKNEGTYVLVPEALFNELFKNYSIIKAVGEETNSFGKLLKAFRLKNKLNFLALERATGVSRQALCKLEDDITTPNSKTVKALTDYFGEDFQNAITVLGIE